MKIKTRRMARDNWSRVIEREYTHAPFACGGLRGELGLLRFKGVTDPLKVMVGDKLTQVIGDGYYWLQIAPEGENWWLTAMFDPELRPLEYYIDVTLENVIDGADSHYRDLFLDVIVSPSGNACLADEDELDAALAEGVITKAQHLLSHTVADRLMAAFPSRINELERFCRESLRQLSR